MHIGIVDPDFVLCLKQGIVKIENVQRTHICYYWICAISTSKTYNQIVLDYCLFTSVCFQKCKTYQIIGEHNLHPKTTQLIHASNMKVANQSEIIAIYQQPYVWTADFLRNKLTSNTKWLFIVLENEQQAERLYREFRLFGESCFIRASSLVAIKNLKPDFQMQYRKNMFLDIPPCHLDVFLETPSIEHSLNHPSYRFDQVAECVASGADNLYYGTPIRTEDLLRNQMLHKMKFQVVRNINPDNGALLGYHMDSEQVKNTLLTFFCENEDMERVFDFGRIKIDAPAYTDCV